MTISSVLNVEDARQIARRRLPRGLFEYIDRGTEDELSVRSNRRALDNIQLTPRTLVDISTRDQSISLFGKRLPSPFVIAPTAVAGLVWYDGEVQLAKAAAAHCIPFCVATQSITPIERIAAESGASLWFQLYVWKNRQRTFDLIERAKEAGAEVLVLTVDTPMGPKREYNLRNGFGIPIEPSVGAVIDVLVHPMWSVRVFLKSLLNGGVPTYAHYPDAFRTRLGQEALGDELALAADLTWDDVRELRRRWPGPLVLKGILSVEDAKQAAEQGVDGIVVSNHGGRNLDCAPGPAAVLEKVVDAVGNRITVLADSGTRRGSDIAKFLSMGAQAVLVGRAPLYGAAIGGTAGVNQILQILRSELDGTMAFLGAPAISDLRGRHR